MPWLRFMSSKHWNQSCWLEGKEVRAANGGREGGLGQTQKPLITNNTQVSCSETNRQTYASTEGRWSVSAVPEGERSHTKLTFGECGESNHGCMRTRRRRRGYAAPLSVKVVVLGVRTIIAVDHDARCHSSCISTADTSGKSLNSAKRKPFRIYFECIEYRALSSKINWQHHERNTHTDAGSRTHMLKE